MQTVLTIDFHGVDHSDALEARIREKFAALERFHDRITACRVTVERAEEGHRKGNLYAVKIHIAVPGGDIVIGRERGRNHAHEDVYVALRDAFGAAVRQLEDHVRRHRIQDVRQPAARHTGAIARLARDEGYGFIALPDGREFYFHRNAVAGNGWDRLAAGMPVHFTEAEGEKGPHATDVAPRA